MSDPNRPTDAERPRRASRRTGVLGEGVRDDPGTMRVRVSRRAEPEVSRLVEWVLNITQARYDAHGDGEPDPYDLLIPESLSEMSDARGRVEEEPTRQRRSTA